MTPEQHLKQIVGDLIITVAKLQAEADDLRAQLAALQAEKGKASAEQADV